MRKAVIALVCVLCIGAVANRSAFKEDIRNRSVVQGIGIDLNDDGTYTVTLETINTENYSNAEKSASPVMNVRTLNGKTVNSAIKSAYDIDGKMPVMSQNRVIVIGKELAEKGIMPALDYFIRDAENYPSVLISVSETKASDFFKKATSETTVVSRDIENIILTSDEDISVSSITLCELVNRYKSAGSSFYMPIVSTVKEGDKEEVAVKSTGIFKDGKLVCSLNEDETASLNFLCNAAKKGAVDFSCEDEAAAISIIKSNTVRKINYDSENPTFFTKIKIEADIAEVEGGTTRNLSKDEIEKLRKCAEEKIKGNIESLCRKLYSANNADAVGLSRLIYIYYPEKFRAQEKNLSEIMTKSQYSVEVEVSIRRIGQDYSS